MVTGLHMLSIAVPILTKSKFYLVTVSEISNSWF